jgi:hypothetical protein
MTFAASVRTLKEDRPVFDKHVKTRRVPNDRELFRHLQALGQHADRQPARTLLGAIPSLATHCELPWIAPVVDWDRLAKAIAQGDR